MNARGRDRKRDTSGDKSFEELLALLDTAIGRWDERIAQACDGLDSLVTETRGALQALLGEALSGPGVPAGDMSRPAADVTSRLELRMAQLSENLDEFRQEIMRAVASKRYLQEGVSAAREDWQGVEIDPEEPDEGRSRHERAGLSAGKIIIPVKSGPPESPVKLELRAFGPDGRKRRLGEILVDAGIISREQLESALSEQREKPQRRLGDLLIEKGYTAEGVVAQVLASQLRLPFVRLAERPVEAEAVAFVSARLAWRHKCVPLELRPDRFIVAISNPFDLVAVNDLEMASDRDVDLAVATPSDIESALEHLYGPEAEGQ